MGGLGELGTLFKGSLGCKLLVVQNVGNYIFDRVPRVRLIFECKSRSSRLYPKTNVDHKLPSVRQCFAKNHLRKQRCMLSHVTMR